MQGIQNTGDVVEEGIITHLGTDISKSQSHHFFLKCRSVEATALGHCFIQGQLSHMSGLGLLEGR